MESIQFEFQRLIAEQPVEETSVTGGEAFLPGLDVPEKKYKVGYTKDVKETTDKEPKLAAGKAKVYMKKKWNWKDAPSVPNRPSKGGEIYKQLFERDIEEDFGFKIGDEVKIPTKRAEFHGTVSGFTDDKVLVDITSGGGSTFKRPNMPFAPNVLVKKDQEKPEETPEETPEAGQEELKEGLTREIKVRSEAQQFKEAARMVNKKLKEVNSILEYASSIKTNLSESEANSTSKLMENMKKKVVEAYKKMKNL